MDRFVSMTIKNFAQVQTTEKLDGGQRCLACHLSGSKSQPSENHCRNSVGG